MDVFTAVATVYCSLSLLAVASWATVGWMRQRRQARRYRFTGTRRQRFFKLQRAYTDTKALGTRTPATGIMEVSSFFLRLGGLSEAEIAQIKQARANSYGGHIWFTGATETLGESGEQLGSAA